MGKHSEWRKLAKKLRRKRIRQQKAKLRDEKEAEEFSLLQNSPSYQVLLIEKQQADQLRAIEEEQLHEARQREWLKTEKLAQEQFRELQKKLALAKEERARQNEKIKLEWEEEQKKRSKLKQQEEQELQEKIKQEELLKAKVEEFIEHGGDTPEHLKTILETNPNKAVCPFFNKTATCRFFDVCSRNHIRPGISKIILIPNFFSHYSLEKTENEHFTDSSLEFENHEVKESYRDFYIDVIPELENYGKIRVFITCRNHEAHLRGSVFVEYDKTNAALKCYRGLNGRWYGGKQLSIQFVNIPSWKSAVCGLSFSRSCHMGTSCNFLHNFRNPGNLYSAYERIKKETKVVKQRDYSESRNWRWSESPEQTPSSKNEEWEIDHPSKRSRSPKNGSRKKRLSSRDRGKRSYSSKHKSKEKKDCSRRRH